MDYNLDKLNMINKKELCNNYKIPSIQVVRALAFIGIFTMHCGVGKFGAWGVSIFIILSGFLMTYTYYNKDIDCSLKNNIKFSINKIKKIYLLYVFMTIVAFILTLPFNLNENIILFFMNIFLLQCWLPDSSVYFSMNGVSWYLSLSLILYFVFPYILKFIKGVKSIKQAFLISLGCYIIQCLIGVVLYYLDIDNEYVKWLTYICPLFRIVDFIIGACFGYIFINKKNTIRKSIATVLEVITIMLICFAYYFYINEIGLLGSAYFKYNMLFTISSLLLIYLFANNQGIVTKILICRPLIYLGNISGYAFLTHQIIFRYIRKIMGLFQMDVNIYFGLIITFIITILFVELYKFTYKNIKSIL